MSDPNTPQAPQAPQTPGISRAARDEIERAFLRDDRDDLLAVLTLRFGPAPEAVQARIAACASAETLERWILAAANVPDWATFLSELDGGQGDFKLVGARYEPIRAAPAAAPGKPPESQPPAGARAKEE